MVETTFYVTTEKPAQMSGFDFGSEVDARVLSSDALIEHNGDTAYRTVIRANDEQSADEIERLLDEDDNVIEYRRRTDDDALRAAIKKTDADALGDGLYAIKDHGNYYISSESEMIKLGEALLRGDRDAYSRWCNETMTRSI